MADGHLNFYYRMNDWEIKAVRYFNKLGGHRTDYLFGLMSSIRFLVFFWSALVAIAIIRHPEIAMEFLLSVVIVTLLHFSITEGIMKRLLVLFFPIRVRPYVAYPEKIKSVGRKFSDSSFPSSHMATTAAMLFLISAFYPSLIPVAVLFTLAMAFSRLHGGMHYPSDILAGTVLGILYGIISLQIIKIFL